MAVREQELHPHQHHPAVSCLWHPVSGFFPPDNAPVEAHPQFTLDYRHSGGNGVFSQRRRHMETCSCLDSGHKEKRSNGLAFLLPTEAVKAFLKGAHK